MTSTFIDDKLVFHKSFPSSLVGSRYKATHTSLKLLQLSRELHGMMTLWTGAQSVIAESILILAFRQSFV